jgi:hypothetical protein
VGGGWSIFGIAWMPNIDQPPRERGWSIFVAWG